MGHAHTQALSQRTRREWLWQLPPQYPQSLLIYHQNTMGPWGSQCILSWHIMTHQGMIWKDLLQHVVPSHRPRKNCAANGTSCTGHGDTQCGAAIAQLFCFKHCAGGFCRWLGQNRHCLSLSASTELIFWETLAMTQKVEPSSPNSNEGTMQDCVHTKRQFTCVYIHILCMHKCMWRFPKKGVPPVIIHFRLEFSLTNHLFWGTPMAMGFPICRMDQNGTHLPCIASKCHCCFA